MLLRTVRVGFTVVVLAGLLTTGVPRPWQAESGGELAPDLAMAPLSNFRIEWVNGRRLLRFTAMMVNQGPGHFEVRGYRNSTAEPMLIDQVTYGSLSRSETNIARRFRTAAIAQYAGDGHNHWHVTDMMRYDLWDGSRAVGDEKVGFCFLDSDRYFGGDPSFYRGSWCSTDPNALSNRMGISVGWGDLYAWNFGLQWVDITSAPSGSFVLRATVDPYNWFTETNDANQCTSISLAWTANSNAVAVHGQEAACWNDWDPQFAADIQWAYQTGITNGCNYNLYCPRALVPREQMASFLARARGLPPPMADHFDDDGGSFHQADINRVADAGITLGCEERRYCPTDAVSRGQMASFLVRAFNLPPSSTNHFTDDEGWWHEADANSLADAGITLGCGGTNFCPHAMVDRGQMAAFLHRAMTP